MWFKGHGSLPWVNSVGWPEAVRVTSEVQRWNGYWWESTLLKEVTLWTAMPSPLYQDRPDDCSLSYSWSDANWYSTQQCAIDMQNSHGYYRFKSTFEWLNYSPTSTNGSPGGYGALSASYNYGVLYRLSNVVTNWVYFK
jgi:hypothetical protein